MILVQVSANELNKGDKVDIFNTLFEVAHIEATSTGQFIRLSQVPTAKARGLVHQREHEPT